MVKQCMKCNNNLVEYKGRGKIKTTKLNNDANNGHGTEDETYKNIKRRINEMHANSNNIYIVNTGSMNHGKSSLFNSLLDREVYAVGDVRMTQNRQDELYEDGVIFVDTPGLSATDKDNDEAFEAFKSANMVVYTHTLKIGELHEEEIKNINKIASLFPSKKYFWKHFCLALTFSESVNAEELDKIKNKILNDIGEKCKGKGFPVFVVSNLRYSKGKNKKKKEFIQHSGILELRKYLLDKIQVWQEEGRQLQQDKIAALIKQELERLEKKKDKIAAKLSKREQTLNSEKERLNMTIKDVFDDIDYANQKYKFKRDDIVAIRSEIVEEVIKIHKEHVRCLGPAWCFKDINDILNNINASDMISEDDIRR